MRFITYSALVLFALYISWHLGMSRHGSFGHLLIFGVITLGANYLLTKRQCLALGVIGLVLGIVGPVVVWSYGSAFVKGDSSGYGMLGTLLAFCFIPIGAGLAFVGWRKEG